MAVLLLRLAAPLQAWGVDSRFTVRSAGSAPSRSGVLGMLAAAVGRRRTDPIEDLLSLAFGVRKDQPGKTIRDFQTAIDWNTRAPMPISNRYYLADGIYLAGVEGDSALIDGLHEALQHPVFPLYLGRRSCPPTYPLSLGTRDTSLLAALENEPWLASKWFRRRNPGVFDAELLIDQEAVPEERHSNYLREVRDQPQSFDPRRREYGFRNVEQLMVRLGEPAADHHDPMAVLEEVQ